MSIDRELQDKLWHGLSEETQAEYREKYKFHLADSKRDPKDNFGGGYDLTVLRSETIIEELVTMFGEHNLDPKPQIKTWEDVEKEYPKILTDFQELNVEITCCCGIENKIGNKMLATAKIAKLIDLGYGGIMSKEEWENADTRKFSIGRFEGNLAYAEGRRDYEFVSFHTPEQRQEFWSHESNRKLVELYHCL